MRLIQNVVRTSYEYLSMCACVCICKRKQSETQQKAEAAPEDSDLDRKRRETEALLQSIGISPEPPLGTVHRPLDRTEISSAPQPPHSTMPPSKTHQNIAFLPLPRSGCVIFWVCFMSLNGTSSKPLFRRAFPVFFCLLDSAF